MLSMRARSAAPLSPVADATIAAVPVTCGVAIDVPWKYAYPLPRTALQMPASLVVFE